MNGSPDFTPPDFRPQLLESALRRFLGGRPTFVLYTDRRRPTLGWLGVTDREVLILVERGLARLGDEQDDGRRRVTLTLAGVQARDALRRPR